MYISIYGQTILCEMSNCTPINGNTILNPKTIWLDHLEMTLLFIASKEADNKTVPRNAKFPH